MFAVKHNGHHKERYVVGGHLTDPPLESVYSGVVSLRSLRLVIFLAELNGLQLYAVDFPPVTAPIIPVNSVETDPDGTYYYPEQASKRAPKMIHPRCVYRSDWDYGCSERRQVNCIRHSVCPFRYAGSSYRQP